jgi:hypothetical protein
MKTFVNEEMDAPNVLRVAIDIEATKSLRPLVTSRVQQRRLFARFPQWRSDIRWLSPRSKSDFDLFQGVFEQLDLARHVKPYVAFDRQIRLYNSMLIVRSNCSEPDFHTDWRDNDNQGFTLMAPLTANGAGFGLLYKKLDGTVAEYDYKLGEGLIFGDDFVHSTKPGASADPVIFLCFNFGTDRMESWRAIESTAGRQALLTCRPDGKFHRISRLQRVRAAVGSALRKAGLRRTPAAPSSY